jgi:hypothetical protein
LPPELFFSFRLYFSSRFNQTRCDAPAEFERGLGEAIGAIIQTHEEAFIQTVLPQIVGTLGLGVQEPQGNNWTWRSPHEQSIFLFIACDVVEYCQDKNNAAQLYWSTFVPQTVRALQVEDNDVRQAAAYLLGKAAPFQAFAPVVNAASTGLASMIMSLSTYLKQHKVRDWKTQGALDNSVAALGYILEKWETQLQTNKDKLWKLWMTNLPLKQDDIESVGVNRQILRMLGAGHPVAQQYFGKCIGVLADSLKTSCLPKKDADAFRQVMHNVGVDKLKTIEGELSQNQSRKLGDFIKSLSNGGNGFAAR